jgi:hypothetical protein
MKTEAACFFEMMVSLQQIALRRILEDCYLYCRLSEKWTHLVVHCMPHFTAYRCGLILIIILQGNSKLSVHGVRFLRCPVVRSADSRSLDWSLLSLGVASEVGRRWRPLDFYLCGYLKAMMYQVKIQNMDHLNERIRDACVCINTRCVRVSWSCVGQTHPYML